MAVETLPLAEADPEPPGKSIAGWRHPERIGTLIGEDALTDAMTLQRGDVVPHFEVRTIGGEVFRYSDLWQHKNLVLVSIPAAAREGAYVRELTARAPEFEERNSACVITGDRVPWLPAPAVLVADRWGEVMTVALASEAASLPAPADLLEWVEYVESRCPECEGEAR